MSENENISILAGKSTLPMDYTEAIRAVKEYMKLNAPTEVEYANLAEVSRNTLRRFLENKPVRTDSLEKIVKPTGYDLKLLVVKKS